MTQLSARPSDGQVRRGGHAARPLWEITYATLLVVLDAVCITAAAGIALAARFNAGQATVGGTDSPLRGVPYSAVIIMVTPVWVLVLGASRCYEPRFLGVGSEEFKRVVNGSVRFAALLALLSFAVRAEISRGFVGVAIPVGVLLLLLARFAARKVLHALRRRHRCLHRVVAVGSAKEISELMNNMGREPHAGFRIVAVSLANNDPMPVVATRAGLRQLGPPIALADELALVDADTVAVAGTAAISSRTLRELSWDLEGTGVDLVVAPAITDVTGPRIHIRPVAGLPLLHVEEPTFGGLRKIVKTCIDTSAALVLLLVLALPLLVIAVLVRLDSEGPVFYRQERVGKDGKPFRIWKFRTMRVGADRELAALSDLNEQDGPLFKMRNDPRVTPVGARLRRNSLDELPQLLNVLTGSMSLVGPRPPLAHEVEQYDQHVHRRLFVKPGMTGLWQVSGRNDLEWEEAVRLDLYYVENWSVLLDVMILWKTVFAVLRSRGAY